MSSITINHEYKEIGTLCLISGSNLNNGTPESGFDHFFSDNKDDPKKSYWLRVNFEHVSTGATYYANFDDGQIHGFCAILKFDPELLNDFMTNKPELKIQQENIIVGFNLQVVSKVYSFNIQIPKYIPIGSPTEVVELRQQNNVLTQRIKTLEDKLTKFTKIKVMFAQHSYNISRPSWRLEELKATRFISEKKYISDRNYYDKINRTLIDKVISEICIPDTDITTENIREFYTPLKRTETRKKNIHQYLTFQQYLTLRKRTETRNLIIKIQS